MLLPNQPCIPEAPVYGTRVAGGFHGGTCWSWGAEGEGEGEGVVRGVEGGGREVGKGGGGLRGQGWGAPKEERGPWEA